MNPVIRFVKNLEIRIELFMCRREESETNRLELFLLNNNVPERIVQRITQTPRKEVAEYRAQLLKAWEVCNPNQPVTPRSLSHEKHRFSRQLSIS